MSKKCFQVLFVAAAFIVLANGKGEATCDVEKCQHNQSEFEKCCRANKSFHPEACHKRFPWGRADTTTFAKWICELWAEQ